MTGESGREPALSDESAPQVARAAARAAQERRWSAWMAQAQDGDGRAYETLLRELVPFVRALARTQLRGQFVDDAEFDDIVQEVLLSVHRVRHTYDPQRPFSPWLAAIVVRRAIDLQRRRARIASYETCDEEARETFADPAANKDMEAGATAEQVQAALAALPAGQRQAFELLKLRGLSLNEAAAHSGQSAGALKVAVHRAIKALRTRLGAAAADERRPRE